MSNRKFDRISRELGESDPEAGRSPPPQRHEVAICEAGLWRSFGLRDLIDDRLTRVDVGACLIFQVLIKQHFHCLNRNVPTVVVAYR